MNIKDRAVVGVGFILIVISIIVLSQLSIAESDQQETLRSTVDVEYDAELKDKIHDAIGYDSNKYHVFEKREVNASTKEADQEEEKVEEAVEVKPEEEKEITEKVKPEPKEDPKEKNPPAEKPKVDPKPKEDFKEIVTKNNVHIFIVPHPDDEVLSMGAGIIDLVEKGKNVHVVLLTKGEGSGAIHGVNKRMVEDGLEKIELEAFVNSRILEFKDAMSSMGISSSNYYVYGLPDGGTSVESITQIIKEYQNKLNPDQFHAISETDKHRDHKNTAIALKNLYNNGTIKNPMFYLSNQDYNAVKYEKTISLSSSGKAKLKNACHSYNMWNPSEGRYAVGWISVESLFVDTLEYNINKVYTYK